ncbi:MAG: hypothetical protein K9K67_08850 [Bacteriovoracaceae bacterium]|nr:hypothetical protein [Bacteriovoracaceae bacterium]
MRLFILILLLLPLGQTFGQVKEEEKKIASTSENAAMMVDAAHESVSNTILLLSNRIDSFFGSRRGDDEANGSRLRVFYDSTFRQDQKWEDRVDMRFSLRLPQLQKLLNLSFKREGGKAPPKEAPKETPIAPKLKDLIVTTQKWTFNFNTGLRVDIPPNLFARARLRRTMLFFDLWEFNPTQEATWFQEQGFGLNFSHDLDYQLAPDLLFRIVNSVFWLDDTDEVTTTHGPSLFQQLSDNRALSYSLQAQGTNRPKYYINNYVASIQYRQLIHSNWLFLEIRPAVDFPKERRWQEVYSLFFRIEAVFGTI